MLNKLAKVLSNCAKPFLEDFFAKIAPMAEIFSLGKCQAVSLL